MSYKIPEKYLEVISKLAEASREKEDNIKSQIVEKYITYKNKYSTKSEANLWRLAVLAIRNRYLPYIRTPSWTGFFIGETDVIDMVEITKRVIDKMSPEEKQKFITETGEYLNPWEQSRAYLEPLPEHTYSKTLFGIVGETGFKNPTFCHLEWNGELATKVPEHSFEVMYDFKANKRKSENYLRLGANKATIFKPSEITIEREAMEELIRKLAPCQKFSKLPDYFDMLSDKARRTIILTEANVARISETQRGGYILTLESPDAWSSEYEGIRAFVPSYVPINFGVNSIILVLGTLYRNYSGRLRMNVLGIFPTAEGYLAPEGE